VYLLVQYKSQSLIEHVRKTWVGSPITQRHFVTVVPPQMRGGPEWFQGTADAVYQSLNLIYIHRPDLVAVFGADHIYRMDVAQMLEFHIAREADVTVAALPVALDQGSTFGVVETDTDGRIRAFHEKPGRPVPMPADASRCLASMGNYLFSTPVLVEALQQAHARQHNDFGRDVLPRLLKRRRVLAYNFETNRVPGTKAYEEPAYWRDVGTIDAYYAAHQDLLGEQPRFDEFNVQWPISSVKYLGPHTRIVAGEIRDSTIGDGSVVLDARVRNSVIGREVTIEDGAEIEDSVVMDYTVVGKGARLRRAVVDRYNMIEPGARIGMDLQADAERYHVSPGGVVVVALGHRGLSLVY
jgi:glucose-1-phosphate adenylyltransferase